MNRHTGEVRALEALTMSERLSGDWIPGRWASVSTIEFNLRRFVLGFDLSLEKRYQAFHLGLGPIFAVLGREWEAQP